MKFSTVILLLSVSICQVYGGHRFGYSRAEQRMWSRTHQGCSGKYQSPIAISSGKAIPLTMPALEMVGYHNLLPGPILMHNNGHSVSLSIPKHTKEEVEGGAFMPYIFGGKLKNEYEFEGLHFHWGDKNNRGSEHVLNDIRFPMEMHIIHRNKKYANVSEALEHPDGLTVLAFFYQLIENDGSELQNLVRNLPHIREYNQSELMNTTFSLSSLLGNLDTERFYTYKGSLTTPPCSEAVTWILFPDTLTVSVSQMSKFRHLSNGVEGSVLVDNYRALQPLNNRHIFVRKVNIKSTPLEGLNKEISYIKWDWLY
ncbi:unnamed protein product [Hermetia illucens]|uniref:Carbonic anhydrase n=1 Tax=Hermetia illucens TaxID=343691 RepID=A0A7R8UB65_HERIL|nr:carbonic anhydrase 2-like [Hermetia illucens]CAD7077560.1 unnamed protein product [Hermetia illucens]